MKLGSYGWEPLLSPRCDLSAWEQAIPPNHDPGLCERGGAGCLSWGFPFSGRG